MKKILTVLAAIVLCSNLFGQIDPTVEVSRHYKVNIADIDRPQTSDNHVADSLQKFDVGFDYSIFDRPYTDLYEFTPYQADSISKVVRRRPPFLMAQVGSQYPFAPELMLRTQLVTKPKLHIGLDGDLKAAIADLDYLGTERGLTTARFNSGVSAHMKHAWSTGELALVLNYKGDAYVDGLGEASLAHTINSIEIGANLASANPADGSVYYSLDLNYVTAAKALVGVPALDTAYNNSKFSLSGTLGASFDRHRVYVNMIYQTSIYGTGDEKVNVGLLEFMPVYEYAQGPLKLRAGARFGNKYIASDAATTIHPEVDIKFELLKNTIWLRGLLSGGNELNSLVDYIHDAPWLCNGVTSEYAIASDAIGVRNIEAKVAMESIVAGRFALSPYISYANYSNKIQLRTSFVSSGLPILLPMYSNYAQTQWGVETSWKSKNLMITANLRHNNPFTDSGAPVYMVADWQADASMEFNIKRRFFLNASYVYESERKNWDGDMPKYSDLTVMLTGVINRHFAVYLKGGNLLDNANYRYFAIPELPRNIGGGLRVNF